MRTIDQATLDALRGSRTGDQLVVYAWYNGRLAWETPLPVAEWAHTENAEDDTKINGTLSLTIRDPDGSLVPWFFDDPLGIGGARLQCVYKVGGAGAVNLGWFTILSNDPAESWRAYRIRDDGYTAADTAELPGIRPVMVSGGASIQLQAQDLTGLVDLDKILAPASPAGGSPTVVSCVKQLVDGILPVKVLPGFTDKAVDPSVLFDWERLEHVQDLVSSASGRYRMGGEGQLELYSLANRSPAWTIDGGAEGVLVDVGTGQDSAGMFNIAVADGTDAITGLPVRGIAQITDGPLRVGGPFGRRATKTQSADITSQAYADKAAAELLATQLSGKNTDLDVTFAPNPALQAGDWVSVQVPLPDGSTALVAGWMVSLNRSGAGGRVNPMTGVVRCDFAAVQAVRAAVGRG